MEIQGLFDNLEKNIIKGILSDFESIDFTEKSFDLLSLQERIKPPSSTWTYIMHDNTITESLELMIINRQNTGLAAMGAALIIPLLLIDKLYKKLLRK